MTATRIMKRMNGQAVHHSWLVSEIVHEINNINTFTPQTLDIKNSIEKLIEKNIIKRSKDNREKYEYIS